MGLTWTPSTDPMGHQGCIGHLGAEIREAMSR